MGHTVRHVNDEGEELYTFEEVFPDAHPGMILRGFRARDEITQATLAEKLGVARSLVSAMECSKLSISEEIAKQLADIFGTSYKCFI